MRGHRQWWWLSSRPEPPNEENRVWTTSCSLRFNQDVRVFAPPSAHLLRRRKLPRAIDDRRILLAGPVQPHHQDEIAGGRREPVGFLVLARRFLLNVEIGRAVRIGLQILPRADR